MGRQPDAQRKAELLEAIVAYLMRNGLADLTLRPLAGALGTNARMLLYHFGSREQLITEALATVRARQKKMLEEWAAEGAGQPLAERFHRFWAWLSSAEMEPYLHLFFEVQVYALRQREAFVPLLTGAVDDWVSYIARDLEKQGVPPSRALSAATILVGATRGLLLDLLATRDRERIDRSFHLLVWQMLTTLPRR